MPNRKILKKSELDKIAAREGFHFFQLLGLGNRLYINENESLNRVYDKYGEVVTTYTPKGCLQNTLEFHNPIEVSGASIMTPALRQYGGCNGFFKRK